jgi:hypothetical protein
LLKADLKLLNREYWRGHRSLVLGFFAVALVYLFIAWGLGLDIFAHSDYDAYTLQAQTWLKGSIALDQDYSWLEIARYGGQYFVSFPPFPAVVMVPFVLAFNGATPSLLVVFLYFMASYVVGYALARRLGYGDAWAACLGAFLVLGCNMLEVAHYGGVWNMAQALAFLLTLLSFYLMTSRRRKAWHASLICIALAVGCRPFQAFYVPVLVYMLAKKLPKAEGQSWPSVKALLPYLLAPAAVAAAYCVYNFVRFGDILEFGHNYLPEFVEAPHGQFSLNYVGTNLMNILRLPYLENGRLAFPIFSGFAFFIANPIYLIWGRTCAWAAVKRRIKAQEALLIAAFLAHFFVMLMHKSFGGWQFGTRYLCDLIPAMYFFILSGRGKTGAVTAAVMIFAVAFNIYGAVVFHVLS